MYYLPWKTKYRTRKDLYSWSQKISRLFLKLSKYFSILINVLDFHGTNGSPSFLICLLYSLSNLNFSDTAIIELFFPTQQFSRPLWWRDVSTRIKPFYLQLDCKWMMIIDREDKLSLNGKQKFHLHLFLSEKRHLKWLTYFGKKTRKKNILVTFVFVIAAFITSNVSSPESH